MRDIITQLKTLQAVRPDTERMNARKTILMHQVAATARVQSTTRASFVLYIKEFFAYELSVVAQPAAMVAVLALLVVSGGIFSITAASEATPGSWLYTMKLVGEKTQFAMAGGPAEKVQLSVSFAERRVNEISTITHAQNYQELEKVAANLVHEITSVQDGLEAMENERPDGAADIARDIDSKIVVLRDKLIATKQLLARSTGVNSQTIDDAIAGVDAAGLRALRTIVRANGAAGADTIAAADVERRVASKIENAKEKISAAADNLNAVFSAGLGRSEQGVQVYSGASQKTQAAGVALAEAEQLLKSNNYSEALDKINESEQLLQEAAQAADTSNAALDDEDVSSSTPAVKGVIEINEATTSDKIEIVGNAETTQKIAP